MIRLVIFDFDDTITDNKILDYNAFLVPCQRLRISSPTGKEILRLRKKGIVAKKIMCMHLKKLQKNNLLSNFLTLRTNFLNSLKTISYLKLQKDVELVLLNIKQRKIKCILCSTKKNKSILIEFLKKNNIIKFFSEILTIEDLGFYLNNYNSSNRILIKKSIIYYFLKNQKIKPKEILFIGNSIDDLKAATEFGISVILYQNSYLPRIDSKKIKLVNNMTHLNSLINSILK